MRHKRHIRNRSGDIVQDKLFELYHWRPELGLSAGKEPGGYGGLKMERKRLGDILKENIDDPRLSDWDRDMIRGL